MSIRYKPKRTYSWSANFAYCIGLLATDGYISIDGRHIEFTSKDYELAEAYQSIMCPHIKIGTKSAGGERRAFRVQHSDVALYDFLINIGLSPNKSKTISRLNLPDEFYRDFLRGCYDGDGSSFGMWDKRWRSSYMFSLAIYSASENFLFWIQEKNIQLVLTSAGSFKRLNEKTRAHRLNYAKTDTRKLFNFMYYSDALPCLSRKKEKLISYFTEEARL